MSSETIIAPWESSSDSWCWIWWISHIQSISSVAQLCPTLCRPHRLHHARLPFQSPAPGVYSKLMSVESMMPSNHLILCHPLLPPSIFPSIRVFANESALHIRWPKYWQRHLEKTHFHSILTIQISRYDASILQHSAFFIVQLSHPYMTTGKTVALTRQIFVGKVMSLLFNMLSRLVITFLPRSKHLLILWLQSPSAVILEPPKIKSVTVSIVSPSICHEVIGLEPWS